MNLDLSQNSFIAGIKQKVRQAQYEALKVVNTQLINLYWEIGKSIAEKQSENWGKAIVATLSKELQIPRNWRFFNYQSVVNGSVLL